MPLAVVILAAGASTRMGRPKLLLPWGATTVLGHLVAQWRRLGAREIGIVRAAKDAGLQEEMDRVDLMDCQIGRMFPLRHIVNEQPALGMFGSIQCAARWPEWDPSLTHWAIALGDQPHLEDSTLGKVMEASQQQPDHICQPAQKGRGRHPVLLPGKYFRELAITDAATFRDFLAARQSSIRLVETADPGLELDLDTPADYEAAQQKYLK